MTTTHPSNSWTTPKNPVTDRYGMPLVKPAASRCIWCHKTLPVGEYYCSDEHRKLELNLSSV
jgi:hypothetical protein